MIEETCIPPIHSLALQSMGVEGEGRDRRKVVLSHASSPDYAKCNDAEFLQISHTERPPSVHGGEDRKGKRLISDYVLTRPSTTCVR